MWRDIFDSSIYWNCLELNIKIATNNFEYEIFSKQVVHAISKQLPEIIYFPLYIDYFLNYTKKFA